MGIAVAHGVGFLLVMIPGQFQFESPSGTAQPGQSAFVVGQFHAPHDLKTKGLLVKKFRFFQIHDPDTGMYHFVFHLQNSFSAL
jgi:hypothetical protein